MKKRNLIPLTILLSTAIFLGAYAYNLKEESVIYSIAGTMSNQVSVTNPETAASISSEAYFPYQWALYNNGTFTLQTKGSEGTEIPNGGFYNRGDYFSRNPVRVPGYRTRAVYALNQTVQVTAAEGIDLDAQKAWEVVGTAGREVIVAVIDTGVDYTHEDLSGAIWVNTEEIAGDGIDNDGNGYVDDVYGWDFYNNKAFVYDSRFASEYDHGTHCAGTIAAEINGTGIAGIASSGNVKILIVKALGGRDGVGDTASIIKAIRYAESMGAEICNLSFGTASYDAKLEQAIKDSNMLFICAAGNGDSRGLGINTDSTPLYPAAFDLDNIISVANLTYDGTLDTSSNYGTASVDIAAPGTAILSTVGGSKYAYLSGTSMSAPMVTAVAALTYSYYEDISVLDAREIVLATGQTLDSLQNKVSTGAMVNAYNAVTADLDEILK